MLNKVAASGSDAALDAAARPAAGPAPEPPRRAIPRELIVAALAAITIVSIWLHVAAVLRQTGGGDQKDFGTFYRSARTFLDGGDIYASRVNLNPPHVVAITLPLATLPPSLAWIVWSAAGLVALGVSLWLIAREARVAITAWRGWVFSVAVIASAAGYPVVALGQISWLLMLPVTLGWVMARRGRWTQAGLLFGAALSAKPFLLLIVPYLVIRRRWRALAAATLVCLAAVGFGSAVFGLRSYDAWIRVLGSVGWSWLPLNASLHGFLSRALVQVPPHALRYGPVVDAPGLVRPLWLFAAATIGTITFAAIWRDAEESAASVDRSLALVLVASLLISPLGWVYYVWLLLGPSLLATRPWWQSLDFRRALVVAAAIGFFWPHPLTLFLQPRGWATLTFGSAYFWMLVAVWLGLVSRRE